jgi:hypothetical protein
VHNPATLVVARSTDLHAYTNERGVFRRYCRLRQYSSTGVLAPLLNKALVLYSVVVGRAKDYGSYPKTSGDTSILLEQNAELANAL